MTRKELRAKFEEMGERWLDSVKGTRVVRASCDYEVGAARAGYLAGAEAGYRAGLEAAAKVALDGRPVMSMCLTREDCDARREQCEDNAKEIRALLPDEGEK